MRGLKVFLVFVGLIIFSTWAEARQSVVHRIKIDDCVINPVVAQYISRAINHAEKDHAQCLIVELDTPGGLLSSTRSIVKELMNADVPVIVYVSPQGARAGSAGVFITLAGHLSAMAPSTNIGAAHPVQLQGKKSTGESLKEIIEVIFKKETRGERKKDKDVMGEKIINDTLAWVSTIAKSRGRNVEWAKRAVTESVSATEDEALALGIVNFLAPDVNELLEQLDGRMVSTATKVVTLKTRNAAVITREMDAREKILNVLVNPTIAYLLMLLGFYGLLFEFTHPGIGFPGIAGVIAIIIAFYGLQMLPTNYAGVALIALALILFIAEVKVPGFGLLALGGIICMLLGSLILVNSPYEFMFISLKVIIPLTLATALIVTFLAGAVIRVHRKKIRSGGEGLIGETGRALTPISRRGKVFIHGEIWNARSEETIAKNSEVEAVKIDGMVIWVKKR
ncbi:MAG: nodulation protein NfeD [Candidatus Ratteibacteria bacterium]|nr:nodulation protein NfeD [Candidatus Ratteibacteria bacterium]